MVPELGVIEGYFGRPWSHEDRKQVLTRLRDLGFSWFHYAPKADAYLRRRWREPHPSAASAELTDLSAHCRRLGVRFGVGLSPYEMYRDFSGAAKVDFFAAFGLGKDDALKSVTLWPAQLMGVADQFGTIEAGKVANLVVTDGDVLEARTNTKYLFIDGRLVPLDTKHTDLNDKFKDRP